MTDEVWVTVDSGAATSCLALEMSKQMKLAIAKTSDLPFTNASGEPVKVHGICSPSVTLGTRGGASISGVGGFKAMDVAKPLLSVAKLVGKGWSVSFTPQGAYMSRKGVICPSRIEMEYTRFLSTWRSKGFQGAALGKSLS